MESSPKLVSNTMSRWTKLCERKDFEASPEKQMEVEEDLLDYLRKWNPLVENELVELILAHRVENVRFDLYDMMLFYLVKAENEYLGSLVDNTMYVRNKVKEHEKNYCYRYDNFQDAVEDFGFDYESRKEPQYCGFCAHIGGALYQSTDLSS